MDRMSTSSSYGSIIGRTNRRTTIQLTPSPISFPPLLDLVYQDMQTGLDNDYQGLCQSFVHAPVPPFVFDLVYPSRKDPLTLKYSYDYEGIY
jgi:hypothetical protein